MKYVIVTGNRGYLGPIVVKALRDRGYATIGVDIGLYDEDIPFAYLPELQVGTVNEIVTAFSNPTAVVHLAAISNDPMGEIDTRLTYNTNVNLVAEIASLFPDSHHVLASSGSVYGFREDTCVEQTLVEPLTAYADSKVKAERILETISPSATILRFGTLWGDSPNFRVDLAINHFAYEAITTGKVEPLSDAKRPFLHVQDAANAIVKAINEGKHIYHGVYNVATENTTTFAAADKIASALNAECIKDDTLRDSDKRSYHIGTLREPHLVEMHPIKLSDQEAVQRLAACASKNRTKLRRIDELKRQLAGND